VFGLDIFSPVMSDFHPRYAWTFATTSSSARTRRTACPNRLRRRLLLSTIIASLGLSFTERFIRSCRRGGITGSSHLLQLHYHDRASLLAGKLHAVLHAKGRDFFDLLQRSRLAITQSHAAQPCACANRLAQPGADP
jgi:hypothetical protein